MTKSTIRAHAKPDAVLPSPLENAWDRLGELHLPLLTVIGTMDAPDHFTMVERLAAGVEGSSSRIIEDSGHMPSSTHHRTPGSGVLRKSVQRVMASLRVRQERSPLDVER